MSEFVIMELDKAFRDGREPFTETIQQIQNAVQQRAQRKLQKLQRGGTVPESGEWVFASLRPTFFSGQGQSPGGSQIAAAGSNFRQSTPGSTGFANALAADLSDSGELGNEWVLGIAGWILMEPSGRYSELRPSSSSGDRTLPVINVEEAFEAFDKPVVVYNFETPQDIDAFVFDEDNDFIVEANFTSTSGSFRLKPLAAAAVPQSVAISTAP